MFKYRLQPLLRFRKSLEEDQQRKLAEADRENIREVLEIQRLNKNRLANNDQRRKLMVKPTNSKMLMLHDIYIGGLGLDKIRSKERQEFALKHVNEEREKLLELVKNRKILELHRDRQKERYDKAEDRKERIQADEMSIMRYALKGEVS